MRYIRDVSRRYTASASGVGTHRASIQPESTWLEIPSSRPDYYGGMALRTRDDDEFALRIVTVDYYLAKPSPGLDVTESPLTGLKVDRVSVPPPPESWHPLPSSNLDAHPHPTLPRDPRRFPS